MRCAPLIDRAAPSLMPAMDIRNSGPGMTYWELWDPRQAAAPAVAKYVTDPGGVFLGGTILVAGGVIDLLGIPTLLDFVAELRRIEAGS
jgi:hypothetical protein